MKLFHGLLTTLSLASALATTSMAEKQKLNILMIAIDDMRPELGCYGATHIKSPNIDRLASQGVLFQKAYCQQAICGPSRASLLTGMRPDSTGVHGNHTHYRSKHPNKETLPEFFKNKGYFTAACGKINHGVFPKGKAPKWDVMGDAQSWSIPAFRPGPRYYYTEDGIKAAQNVFKRMFPKRPVKEWDQYLTFGPLTEAPEVADDVLYDGQVANKAIEHLKQLGKDQTKPFFLAVGFIKPHTPYIAPKKYWDLYDHQTIQLASNTSHPNGAPRFTGHGSHEKRRYTDQPNKGPFSEANQRKTIHAYYACISYIDAQIGRILTELKNQNLHKNTIIILWSDHGYHLGEHGLWGKTTNYELDTRVAMICSAPGKVGNGKTSDALVELVDIYPTLTELTGFKAPKYCEGTSYAKVLNQPHMTWKKAAYSQFPRGKKLKGYTCTDGRYRYMEWIAPTGKVMSRELYDHKTDPGETLNLIRQQGHTKTADRLSKLLNKGQGWKAVRDSL